MASGERRGKRHDTLRSGVGVPLYTHHHPFQDVQAGDDVDRTIVRLRQHLASVSILRSQLREVFPKYINETTSETDGRYLRNKIFRGGAIVWRRCYLQVCE